jgi:hypothetical protein
VLGYVHADIVEAACVHIPVTRDAIAPNGILTDPTIRDKITKALATLAHHVADRDVDALSEST